MPSRKKSKQKLRSRGASLSSSLLLHTPVTRLQQAAVSGDSAMVRQLAKDPEADLNAPLHFHAPHAAGTAGAACTITTTALLAALDHGHEPTARMLLDCGACIPPPRRRRRRR